MRLHGAAASLLLLAACAPERQEQDGSGAINLPTELSEVSGLAVAGPDSVFTHDDEYAIVYEIRLRDGHIVRAFALGDPTLEGDFEGIAEADGRVFLVTSDGLIYSAAAGENARRVSYRVYDSGIGPRCEVEGLSRAPEAGDLLLLCKRFRNGSEEKRLEVYRWTIGNPLAHPEPYLSLPLEDLFDEDERAEFRPSGIEWDEPTGRLFIVSAKNRTVLVLDKAGKLIERRRLNGSRHPETEGITIMPDGRLVLADEGSRTREGRLTAYAMPGN